MFYLRLLALIIISPAMTAVIYLFGKRSPIKGVPLLRREVIAGIAFSLSSIALTHMSIPLGGALVSTRDSAVLSASLIFGPVAGLISATVSAVERLFSAGATYTAPGAAITTFLSGVVGASLRYFMFDNRKPSWVYAFFITFSIEVVNMLFVFLTNMNDVRAAFALVESAAVPMILSNSVSSALALYVVSLFSPHSSRVKREKCTLLLSQVFSRWLFACVILAFIISSAFIYVLQTRLSTSDASDMLALYISDVSDDINDASDENLLALTGKIRDELERRGEYDRAYLMELLEKYDVSEINIIGSDGIINLSTKLIYTGFNMAGGEQSREFLSLLDGKSESLVQRYQRVSHTDGVDMKYAAFTLDEGGFVQVGYNSERFQRDISSTVVGLTRNRHVGESGFMLIANENNVLVSDPEGNEGKPLSVTGIRMLGESADTLIREIVYGDDSYIMYGVSEGYYIIGVMPVSEVVFARDISLCVTLFIEIMVFAMLFLLIYFLVKSLVVDNIQKINNSLEEITGGNLSASVDVRTNREFVSLSDDINSTVDTLKGYIKEAAERIDRELEAARTIQLSTLPSVFPPCSERTDFDIWATMDTAREVGGDFYDFYLLDDDRLVFLIADVSGKGISAAMFMMRAKTTIKSYSEHESDVAAILTKANSDLCKNNDAEMFVTCWMGIMDFRTNTVSYANAGHNPPLVRHKGGEWEYFRTRPGFVLAGLEETKYKSGELVLMPGDEIFLYTDGVTEAADSKNELYGEARLRKSLERLKSNENAEEICCGVKSDVELFVKDADQADDMTMLLLKIGVKENECK